MFLDAKLRKTSRYADANLSIKMVFFGKVLSLHQIT